MVNNLSLFAKKIFQSICWLIIIWFTAYFLLGERIPIEFNERCWSYTITDILVFGAAAAIYILIILQMNARYKWWKNLFLFLGGLVLATIPLLLYHGYFQYQCKFWSMQRMETEVIYYKKSDINIKVEKQKNHCVANQSNQNDTLIVKSFTPYLNIIHPIDNKELKGGNWIRID